MRYRADSLHFATPTDDNRRQGEGMTTHGLFRSDNLVIGAIIGAEVNKARARELAGADTGAMDALMATPAPVRAL